MKFRESTKNPTSIGIKALKNNVSAVIKQVEASETVLVSDRGKVVARIIPEAPVPAQSQTEQEILAQLVREGRPTPAKERFTGPPRRIDWVPFDELMRGLVVELATYDRRLADAATAMGFRLVPL